MTYYSDLSPYTGKWKMDCELLNIGWLDQVHPYPIGTVSEHFIERLWQFCRWSAVYVRGFQPCFLCTIPCYTSLKQVHYGEQKMSVGDGEIRVFGSDNRVYAAPNMIFHYVQDHGYKPPQQFIDSVLNSPLPMTQDYDAKLGNYTWWQSAKRLHAIMKKDIEEN